MFLLISSYALMESSSRAGHLQGYVTTLGIGYFAFPAGGGGHKVMKIIFFVFINQPYLGPWIFA